MNVVMNHRGEYVEIQGRGKAQSLPPEISQPFSSLRQREPLKSSGFRRRLSALKTAKRLFPEGILFASGNRGKFAEVADLFSPLGVDILFGPEHASLDVEETGTTYSANARLKARAWALLTGLPSLADDSGVEVRALEWKPGIHSARMAEDDPARIRWMLDALREKDDRLQGTWRPSPSISLLTVSVSSPKGVSR